jgi:hypothetical protein
VECLRHTLACACRGPCIVHGGTSALAVGRFHEAEIGLPDVWLWRRVPHPETLVSGGPEIDFALQGERVLVLGEAKWRSLLGRGQGVAGDLDQLQLWRMVVERWHRAFYPTTSRFVILLVGREQVAQPEDFTLGPVTLHVRQATWGDVASIGAHPHREELARYVAWKARHSQA